MSEERYFQERARIEQGTQVPGQAQGGRQALRPRSPELLLDPGSEFQEDFLFARNQEPETPADGVVTGVGRVGGRAVCIMANDYTVKAGSLGEKTVQKIVRIQERASGCRCPCCTWSTPPAVASRSRSGSSRPLPCRPHLLQRGPALGRGPQVCILFGPSPAGSAYLPALTDVRDHGRGQGEPVRRLAPDGGDGHRREDHARGSGRGADALLGLGLWGRARRLRRRRDRVCKRYLAFMPGSCRERPPLAEAVAPRPGRAIEEIVPYDQRKWFDMYEVIDRVVDAGSFFEMKRLFAAEVIVGLARIGGRAVGVVANQPKVKGGVLMVDSSDKAARFIWLCNAYNIPLLYLADVSGFMVGSKVERAGIIRHGAKMVFATSQATVPKISRRRPQVLRRGALRHVRPRLRARRRARPAQGQVAIMGPEPAVNAVYYNRIMELPEGERAGVRQAEARRVRARRRHLQARLRDARRRHRARVRAPGRADQAPGLRRVQAAARSRLAATQSCRSDRARLVRRFRAHGVADPAPSFLTLVPVPGHAGRADALGRAAWWFPRSARFWAECPRRRRLGAAPSCCSSLLASC